MIDVNDLRKGVTFQFDGEIYKVLEYSHNKPGRGNATIRTKVRNLRTGGTLERTFQSGDRVQDIRLDHHIVTYLYHDGDLYYFMDTVTYEQTPLSGKILGESAEFLKDGMELKLTFYDEEPIDIELPTSVELKVVESEPSVKGDTATGANKYVTTETGHRVQVPLFVNVGDTVRIDTRTGEYLTRV
ncbi:MAG: elongation factor P [Chloroflexi bacterium]|nr:elongation factor P [Chloroflexota bacterium]MBI3763461.1 elongation factor P [Chloroflexota bacterium]